MTVSMITAGLLGILLLFLSGHVIAGRVKFKIDIGDGGNEQMRQRIRAQANFTEYVPLALLLIFGILAGVFGVLVVLGREAAG